MKQEIKHIRNILKEYARLKRDIRVFSQVSSPVLSGMPSGGTRNNGIELKMVNYLDLSYKMKQVEDALRAIKKPQYQFILVDYIIEKKHSVEEICTMWGVSRSKFNYMKNEALEEFDDNYYVKIKKDRTFR